MCVCVWGGGGEALAARLRPEVKILFCSSNIKELSRVRLVTTFYEKKIIIIIKVTGAFSRSENYGNN